MCDAPRDVNPRHGEGPQTGVRVGHNLHTASASAPGHHHPLEAHATLTRASTSNAGASRLGLTAQKAAAGGTLPSSSVLLAAAAAAVAASAVAMAVMPRSDDQGTQPAPAASISGGEEHAYDGLTFVSHMIAGSVAGTVEHTAMYPVDTIKTRMQALYHPGHEGHAVSRASVRQALRTVLAAEGVAGLYRGVAAVAAGAGPAHALHFAVYEWAKQAMGGNRDGLQPLKTAAAGCVATVVNDALMTPVDSVKQRCQLEGSPYRGPLDAARSMLRQEGPSAFFRSYRTTLVMNVPYTAMHFSVYEAAKKVILKDDVEEETLQAQLVAGGLAGGAAAAVTTPLDVVKTRLQTQQVTSAVSPDGVAAAAPKYSSSAVLPTLRQIVREEGVRALWQGLTPRVLFHMPAAAVCWGTYESMKTMLGASSAHHHHAAQQQQGAPAQQQ